MSTKRRIQRNGKDVEDDSELHRLKAIAYDIIAARMQLDQKLAQVNQMIANYGKDAVRNEGAERSTSTPSEGGQSHELPG